MQSDGVSGSSIGDRVNVGTLIASIIELPSLCSVTFSQNKHSTFACAELHAISAMSPSFDLLCAREVTEFL